MHVLTLDFQATRNRAGMTSILLLMSGIVVAASLCYICITQFNMIETLQSRQSSLERQTHRMTHAAPLSAAQAQQQRTEIKEANAVVSQLSLPWTALFNDLGKSQQKRVALLSIIPDASKHSIKLTGESKNLSALLAYIRDLQKAKSLRAVFLQSHQVELRTAEKPVHFSILATWVQTP